MFTCGSQEWEHKASTQVKDQEKPSRNTGQGISSDDVTVASVQQLPIEIQKQTDRNVGRKQSIPVRNADYRVTNGSHQSRSIALT